MDFLLQVIELSLEEPEMKISEVILFIGGVVFVVVFGIILLVAVAMTPPVISIEYEYVTIDNVLPFIEDKKLVYYFKTDTRYDNILIKAWNTTSNTTIDVEE